MVLSDDGCVYRGKCNQIALPASALQEDKSRPNLDIWQNNDQNKTEISREHVIRIELQRVPNIDRAIDIYCDEGFSSFAVLQESHSKYFRKPQLPRREHSFKKLLHDTSDCDAVHDVVFHVDGEKFPAHKFIIYSRAPGLRELIRLYLDKDIYLKFEHLTGKMFELVLKHIYSSYWPTEDGELRVIRWQMISQVITFFLSRYRLHSAEFGPGKPSRAATHLRDVPAAFRKVPAGRLGQVCAELCA